MWFRRASRTSRRACTRATGLAIVIEPFTNVTMIRASSIGATVVTCYPMCIERPAVKTAATP